MTSFNGYIQGLGGGEKRTVDKRGKEIKLSVYDDIDTVIVFNEAGETSQTTLTGKNLLSYNVTTQTVAGVDFDFYSDGSIHIHGTTNASNCFLNLNYVSLSTKSIPSGSYKVNIKGGSTARLQIISSGSVVATLSGSSFTDVTIPNDATSSWARILVSWSAGTTVDETVYPMICRASETSTEYEPYCGGVPSPNPDYPQDIEGIGFKRQDGTYTVRIDYDDGDERFGSITASGLAYPLYEGDILDFVNGKVIRANGFVDMGSLSWVKDNNAPNTQFYVSQFMSNKAKFYGKLYCDIYKGGNYTYSALPNYYITAGNSQNVVVLRVRDESKSTYTALQFTEAVQGINLVYELKETVEEYITLSGDITDIGTATVTAEGTLTVKYDKARMAVKKYSSPPEWSGIGYQSTPQSVLDAFDYAKRIYDTWDTSGTLRTFGGDTKLFFFPNVDLTGYKNYNSMFDGANLMYIDPITIGETTPTGDISLNWAFRKTLIDTVTINTVNASQKITGFNTTFSEALNLQKVYINAKVGGTLQSMFSGCTSLTEVGGDFDTSSATNFSNMFENCTSLVYVPGDDVMDTSSVTNLYRCFKSCSSLESPPDWDLSSATNLQQMFWQANKIKNIPPYNIPAATNLTNMFQASGSNLTDTSRNNILMMLATASAYTGTKTLAQVGFTSSMYSAASWQALAKYADFVDAGWSIGYS